MGILYKANPHPNLQKKQIPDIRKSGHYAKIHYMNLKFIFDEFEGPDFKYDNSFFKITAQKPLNKASLVQNLGIFILARNVAIRQFCMRALILIMAMSLSNSSPKTPKSGILVLNLRICTFA